MVAGDPPLAWGGTWKTSDKALGNLCALQQNMQICKSPQAVKELIPNLVQEEEKQLLPRVLQLPCTQDFNAGTRRSSEKKGWPKGSFLMQVWVLYMEKRAGKLPGDPAVSPQPQSSSGICSQRESGRIRSGRSIQNSGTPDLHISLGNCSSGITQWCWSCLLGSGVVKMIN